MCSLSRSRSSTCRGARRGETGNRNARLALIGVDTLAATGATAATATAGHPLDCTNWRYGAADEPASLPAEFDRTNYKRTSLRDPDLADVAAPALRAEGLCGRPRLGRHARPRPTCASRCSTRASSGPTRNVMGDLAVRAYVNLGEARRRAADGVWRL